MRNDPRFLSLFVNSIFIFPCSYQVFFREKAYELLMTKIEAEIGRRVTQLQRWFRAMLCRKQFLQKRAAAVIIQVLNCFL